MWIQFKLPRYDMRASTLRADTFVTKIVAVWQTVIIFLIILGKTGKGMETCPTVQQTARRVQRCPMNEIEWESAATYKTCGELHRTCTFPTHFKYHCALNVFLNETWEVCAPERYMLGYCIEYNNLGNRIQDNYKRKCLAMDPPCPNIYKSTEAYKYQECYQKVKPSLNIYGTTTYSNTHTTMLSNANTMGETNEEKDNGNVNLIVLLTTFTGIVSVITTVVIVYLVRKRRYLLTKNLPSDSKKTEDRINEVELHPLKQCDI
ncbi:uncharacterized protein LOC125667458 isoform X3 [Ostrea edulis]|uniref:uncharacterized protein LOC125667458 isoform X2 n=1 Tax=Ostrea edulis TaxID=37623 RepID=UPI0024AFEAF6|nr:uncharacterized protein LOC125667458 isoform X2 [Ostrea edulis]XP_056020600.1 uncharacterized protein LOC125667458 isoform X3 [Ostrea edulis]